MTEELRIEQVREHHIESYVRLSYAEYGKDAAVSQASHLRWKFLENPQGPSIGIHLYKDGELIGRMIALTRQFRHKQKLYRAAHIVDFLVHPKERGMHSLVQLVLGLNQLSGFDFLLIMAPNPAGAAVWENFVKMKGYFDLDVAVAPLRPAAMLQSAGKFDSGAFAPVLDRPWQFILRTASGLGTRLNHFEIEMEWPDPAEIDQMLSDDCGDRAVGVRSAKYLNWRYRRSPIFRYKVCFLRERERLIGYFVVRRSVYDGIDCLFIVDAFGRPYQTWTKLRTASLAEISRVSTNGAEMALILGNTKWGSLSAVSRFPFLKVPPRFLPRKTTVYAQWLTSPGFEIQRNSFYVTLGDSDVI